MSPRPIVFLLALTGLVHGQRQRGPDLAPKLGDTIPKVSATSPDGRMTIDLSKPKRLTVLIFGSHT